MIFFDPLILTSLPLKTFNNISFFGYLLKKQLSTFPILSFNVFLFPNFGSY